MLNSKKSNLELLSLELSYQPSLEEYLDFISEGFPRLKTLKLCLSNQLTLGELVSFSRLQQALTKPPIFPVLVLKVSKLTLLDKSQLKDYHALGNESSSISRVLGIVERKYRIQIDTAWKGSRKKVYRLNGHDWNFTVEIDLDGENNFIKII